MARRPGVVDLPEDLRAELDARLVKNGFSDYSGQAAWLADEGHDISRSALHRHGQALEADYKEAMADARAMLALARASGDMGEAGSEIAAGAAAILQTDIVRTVLEIRHTEDPAERAKLLAQLTRAQADVGRLSVSVERHRAEARAAALAEQRQKIEALGKTGAISPEALQAVIKAAYEL